MKFLFAFMLLFSVSGVQAEKPYRILVDKIFSRTDDRRIPEEDFAKIRKLGIQVLCPRWSVDEASVERDLELCRQNGLAYLLWQRGTFQNDTALEWHLTTADGKSSPLYSPNSDIFWRFFKAGILDAARLPKPNLGVFLDFEHYHKSRIMEPYGYSYDAGTISIFRSQTGLEAKSSLEEFHEFQRNLWQKKLEELARELKTRNPSFRFFIYPGLGTPFLRLLGQVMRQHGFEVNSASAATYGRETFQSLAGCAEVLTTAIANAREDIRCLVPDANYLAGLDPIEQGSTPELLALKMKAAVKNGDGYWIFFEGFRRNAPIVSEYCDAIAAANHDIDRRNYEFKELSEPETAIPEISFTRLEAPYKIFVSGEMRGAITRFYQQFPQFEAVNMTGTGLAGIHKFQLLVLQRLTVASVDREKVYRTLREYVYKGGAILFTYSSIESLPGIFPEIAAGTSATLESAKTIDQLKVAGKLRILKQKKTFLENIPFDKYSAHYPYTYPMAPGINGTVISVNQNRQPVAVAGFWGKGRVAFVGDFFGRREVAVGDEKEFFLSISKFLLQGKNNE